MRLVRNLTTARATFSTASTASTSAPSSSEAPRWVQSMPTRAIAHVLMQRETQMAPHDELFHEVQRMGMVKSHRHFKQCLKMMKLQKRVNVLCTGLVRVGSAKRKFAVKLTSRGNAVYRFYRNCENWAEQNEREGDAKQRRGLNDAL